MDNETSFHRLADAFLSALLEQVEDQDVDGEIDAHLQGGVLTLAIENGKTFIVSKHLPSRQIWLSSPMSGGLHFNHHEHRWQLADGRELLALLAAELSAQSGIAFTFRQDA